MAQQENKNTFYRKHRSLWQIQDGNTDVAVKMQHWYSKLPLHALPAPHRQQLSCYSWTADDATAACSEFAAVCIRQAPSLHTDGPCLLCTTAA